MGNIDRPDESLFRIRRWLDGADNEIEARLYLFGQIASFCQRLSAISGILESTGLPSRERNYNRFKSQVAPKLKQGIPGSGVSPLARLHEFPLHRAYLAASRYDPRRLRRLPANGHERPGPFGGGFRRHVFACCETRHPCPIRAGRGCGGTGRRARLKIWWP